MDLGLGGPQRFKNLYGSLFGGFADRCFIDDLPDFFQATKMFVGMFMRVRMFTIMMRVFILVMVVVLLQEFFARKLLFALVADHDIELERADAATLYARDFQPGFHTQSFDSFGQQLEWNTTVEQRAQKHVATNPGKTL